MAQNNGTAVEHRPTEKPLNQTQLKNLKELVTGDFADLSQQLITDIERRTSKRIEAINERYDKQADLTKAREKLIAEGRKAEDRLQKVVNDLKAKGIDVQEGRYSKPFTVEINEEYLSQQGRDREIAQAKQAGQRLKNQVRVVVNREERQVMRQVLLQGISAVSAMELINDLPQSEDVMSLVAAELQMTSQDDLKVLMTEDELTSAKELEKGSE